MLLLVVVMAGHWREALSLRQWQTNSWLLNSSNWIQRSGMVSLFCVFVCDGCCEEYCCPQILYPENTSLRNGGKTKTFLGKLNYVFLTSWLSLREILEKKKFRQKKTDARLKVWAIGWNKNRESGNMWISNNILLYSDCCHKLP